jgi:hypothetical protein
MSGNMTATGVYFISPSGITDTMFAIILLTHSEDAQVFSVLTPTETPATSVLTHKTLVKLLLCLVNLTTLYQPTGMMMRFLQ